MFGSQYYHELIRKYVSVFGTLFNDIQLTRRNANNDVVQVVVCPIAYGPKESWVIRANQDPNLDQPVAITLPRLGFEITNIEYSPQRQKNNTIRNSNVLATDGNVKRSQYVPVPWDLNFSLYIMVRNADDGTQIIEQILPFFRPEWTVAMNLIPDMDITMDVPYVLQSVTLEDTYEGAFEDRRAIIWTLDFSCKAWFFGPVSNTGLIKRTIINIIEPEDGTSRDSRITITPGLLANGAPTSNSAASIPISQIDADDNYGFATDIEFFTDGLVYDPTTGNDV